MNNQQKRDRSESTIALHATGEYIMNHIADVMEMVQDTRVQRNNELLDEKTLILVEAEVKAIAEELIQQATIPATYFLHVRNKKWFTSSTSLKSDIR